MSFAIVWIIGTIIGNIFADVTTVTVLVKCRPTFYGLASAIISPGKMVVPKPYKAFNIYFSVLLTWALAVICAMVLIGIVVYAKISNYREAKHKL